MLSGKCGRRRTSRTGLPVGVVLRGGRGVRAWWMGWGGRGQGNTPSPKAFPPSPSITKPGETSQQKKVCPRFLVDDTSDRSSHLPPPPTSQCVTHLRPTPPPVTILNIGHILYLNYFQKSCTLLNTPDPLFITPVYLQSNAQTEPTRNAKAHTPH